MDLINILLIGLILGWFVEWVIDWFLWRRENEKLTTQLAEANEKIVELETDLMVKTEQLSILKEKTNGASQAHTSNGNGKSNGNQQHTAEITPNLKLLPETTPVYLIDNKEVCAKQGQVS